MRALILVLFLLLPIAAHAQVAYTLPPNAMTPVFVPVYAVTMDIWMLPQAIGYQYQIMELHPDGKWYVGTNGNSGETSLDGLQNAVTAAGGEAQYTESQRVQINNALRLRYPPIGGGPSPAQSVMDRLNAILGGAYAIKLVDGYEVFGAK